MVSCKKEDIKVVTDTNPLNNDMYLSPYTAGSNSGRLLVLDKNGVVKTSVNTAGIAMNFRKWNINGTTRFTWLVEDLYSYHIPGFQAYVPGYFVIADENMNELKRVYLTSHDEIDATLQNLVDSHDFVLLSDDHYICMSYYKKEVTNVPASLNPAATVTVVAPIIQEVNNGVVVWQWDGTLHPELYGESVEGNDFSSTTAVNDYLHLNSMTIDPSDNNLVCSFRNADMVAKIDRTTGNFIWQLGGANSSFPLTAEQKFLRQHHATFADNGSTLLLFDNGEVVLRPYSRILEFKLDQAAHTINGFKSYDIPADFSQFMGSVQKTDSTYFIGGGTANYVMEVNYLTGQKLLQLHLSSSTYRAYKYY